ncbi:MAG: biotin/lipoyl-binding protein [Gemmatimonadales bacterium]|nr:biotin/lipoyl-binding protein [Gemmatimonadales bacterium]
MVGGKRHEIVVDGTRVTVDGKERQAELQPVEGTPLRLLLLDGTSWSLVMESNGPGAWQVEEGGERVEVEVQDERTHHIRSLVGDGVAPVGPAVLKAPMPGLVVRVAVEVGQTVSAGQSLVVLEAMKMENELKAQSPGVVERVAVTPGQAVEKGQVLIGFAGASPGK